MSRAALNSDQQEAFQVIQRFLDSPADTLVLQGYAGTGKTFLMQYVAKWLKERDMEFRLLASTGRAATVLRGKTGFETKTVHSELYSFSKVDGVENAVRMDLQASDDAQLSLQFELRAPDIEQKLYIVDEASMLSSEQYAGGGMLNFGSGFLLTDFFAAVGGNKVIFVGDPCQLPPVGQAFSPALDMDWLAGAGRTALKVTLNKIERNANDNDILVLANSIRNMVDESAPATFPKIPATNISCVQLHPSDKDLFNSYREKYKEVGSNGTLAIARSNKTVATINRAVRRDLFGELDLPVQLGDVLLVVQNNYAVPLANGDFCVVRNIGSPRRQAGLSFQSITVEALATGEEHDVLLSHDILYGRENNFNDAQQRSLMIDFGQRMQKQKVEPGAEGFNKKMLSDPYLNCLRAKYGYAVTCHKAQGGEWDHVYLFLDKGMYGMPKHELFRWWYTAVTRTKVNLHLARSWWIG